MRIHLVPRGAVIAGCPKFRFASLACAGALALLSTSAQAQDATESELRAVVLNEQGASYFERGEYRLAVERFIEAYTLERDANILFNIASCYELMGDEQAALEKYRLFVESPDADPNGLPRARSAIQRLSAAPALPASDPAQPSEPPASVRPGTVDWQASAAAIPKPAHAAPSSAQPSPADEAGSRNAVLWGSVATATALGIAGTTLYWMGADDHSQLERSPGFDNPNFVSLLTRSQAEEQRDRGSSRKAWGVASLTLSGLMFGAIGGWFLWEHYSGSQEQPTQVSLVPSTQGASFLLTGQFQ